MCECSLVCVLASGSKCFLFLHLHFSCSWHYVSRRCVFAITFNWYITGMPTANIMSTLALAESALN